MKVENTCSFMTNLKNTSIWMHGWMDRYIFGRMVIFALFGKMRDGVSSKYGAGSLAVSPVQSSIPCPPPISHRGTRPCHPKRLNNVDLAFICFISTGVTWPCSRTCSKISLDRVSLGPLRFRFAKLQILPANVITFIPDVISKIWWSGSSNFEGP